MNRHSPDSGEFLARIAPLNGLGNGKSPCRGQRSKPALIAPKRWALIAASAALNFVDSSFGDTEMAQPEEAGERALRGPARIIETVNKVVRTSQQMLPEIGRQPTPEELAERLAMPLEKVHRVLAIANRPIRLETPIGPG
jgi:hypothetical protein